MRLTFADREPMRPRESEGANELVNDLCKVMVCVGIFEPVFAFEVVTVLFVDSETNSDLVCCNCDCETRSETDTGREELADKASDRLGLSVCVLVIVQCKVTCETLSVLLEETDSGNEIVLATVWDSVVVADDVVVEDPIGLTELECFCNDVELVEDRVGVAVGVRVVSLQYLPRKLGRQLHPQNTLV